VFTVCWSNDENRVAGWPLFRFENAVWNVVVYSRMSGHALILVLLGDGGWAQF